MEGGRAGGEGESEREERGREGRAAKSKKSVRRVGEGAEVGQGGGARDLPKNEMEEGEGRGGGEGEHNPSSHVDRLSAVEAVRQASAVYLYK